MGNDLVVRTELRPGRSGTGEVMRCNTADIFHLVGTDYEQVDPGFYTGP